MQQQRQTDMDLSSVQHCLDIIEADCQLSDASADAVRQARQHVDSCVHAHSAASDAVSSWMWLQRHSDMQLNDSHVCIVFPRQCSSSGGSSHLVWAATRDAEGAE